MPPRKKVSAPAGRVYKSSVPLTQTKLQPPEKRIRCYGKNTSKHVPKPDNTLTQMDFVNLNQLMDEEDSGISAAESIKTNRQRRRIVVDDDQEKGDDMDEADKWKKRRRTTGRREDGVKKGNGGSGRRKTMGDEPSPASKYYTQTLTQMESFSSRSSPPAVQEDGIQEQDIDYDVLVSSQTFRLHHKAASTAPQETEPSANGSSPQPMSIGSMLPPQTPHRTMALEIPSSQSPMTPFSFHSARSSTGKRRPLSEKELNAPIPFSTVSKPPKFVIQDTFSTGFGSEDSQTHAPTSTPKQTSPPKQSSPAKSVRFADQEEEKEEKKAEEEEAIATPSIKSEPMSTQFPASPQSLGQCRQGNEILDSDAESDINDDDLKLEAEQEYGSLLSGNDSKEQEPETCYGEIGLETQMEAEQLLINQKSIEQVEESQVVGDTQSGKSQFLESQRISRKAANLMAPRTKDSDIFISLHPPHIKNIVNRKKDHEFRSWALPPTVVRLWIYETAPASRIKYMIAIGPAKRPGSILDERGMGNAEFNTKRPDTSEFAYEILDLYELANPRNLAELKEIGWLKGPPQKMVWVRPAVLDDLMGNLKPPIFTRIPLEESQSSPPTDTQEAEAQLLSTIQQFTQSATSEPVPSTPTINDKEDEEDDFTYAIKDRPESSRSKTPQRIRLSQAETVDLSQAETPRHHYLPEIIWESPTRPVPSVTPQLPTPFPKAAAVRSESVVPFSMASSQLLSKSQMLPDSLLNESIPAPPDFIQDSDEED